MTEKISKTGFITSSLRSMAFKKTNPESAERFRGNLIFSSCYSYDKSTL